ncbi:ADP-ribosyltransferase [Nocardia harenae]|uniref:ADP-ribosyltransferase n=1 Tax=Nocardia harenae TaxID=358707 RepID=UPI0012EE095F|nr:ADP-ribosyltransferase [Nocardia harenae]
MTELNVDPIVYTSAASNLNTSAVDFHAAFAAAMGQLSGITEMGGTVGACRDWSSSYDATSIDAYTLSSSLVQAIDNYADILQQAGYNYALADHQKGTGRPEPVKPTAFPFAWSSCPQPPPSAGGPGSGLVDDGFQLASKAGIPIPDGDPDKLLSAAAVWDGLAKSGAVAGLPAKLESTAQSFDRVTAPESSFIDEDIREMKAAAEDVGTIFADIAQACRDQKAAIDDMRAKLRTLLEDLAEEIAIEIATTVVFSAVAGALSAGFGAAAVAAYRGGKIVEKVTRYAGRIKSIIETVRFAIKVKTQKVTSTIRDKLQRIIDLVKRRGDDAARRTANPSLTQKDLDALRDYTGAGYQDLNRGLREGTVDAAQQARIDATNEALSKLPDHSGVVYRGTTLPQDVIDNYKEGTIVTEKAFTSTSSSASTAFPGNVEYTIVSKTGKDVKPFSAVETPGYTENEVLFRSGTNFEVLKNEVDPRTGKTIIHLVER